MYVRVCTQTTVDQFGTICHSFANLVASQKQFYLAIVPHPPMLWRGWPKVRQRVCVGPLFNLAYVACYVAHAHMVPPNVLHPRITQRPLDRPAISQWPCMLLCNFGPWALHLAAILLPWLGCLVFDRPTT